MAPFSLISPFWSWVKAAEACWGVQGKECWFVCSFSSNCLHRAAQKERTEAGPHHTWRFHHLICHSLLPFPNTGSTIYLEAHAHTHKSKQPNKTSRSTYLNTHINTHVYIYVFNLTGSKLSSASTDAVTSGDLLQPALFYMYRRILFRPLKLNSTGILSPFSLCISVS